jgi:hypothetical protein
VLLTPQQLHSRWRLWPEPAVHFLPESPLAEIGSVGREKMSQWPKITISSLLGKAAFVIALIFVLLVFRSHSLAQFIALVAIGAAALAVYLYGA